ncbi:MAG: GntP family permease [Planctomycetia bacterium]|nr:GntP family permease [Planctomycetia bacterium]
MDPLLILAISLVVVIGMISFLRLNPFLALMSAAVLVSFLSPDVVGQEGEWVPKLTRATAAFGETAGKIALLIAMGAIIGECMTKSGAADRIVRTVATLFGPKRFPHALMSGGFLLSIPVFYDTTFYLLLPLARGIYRLTQKNYVLYLLAIGFGATLSHTLIPPTPGPLLVATNLNIPLGTMLIVSLLVGVCTLPFALLIAYGVNAYMPNPAIEDEAIRAELRPQEETQKTNASPLPSLWLSILPILLPVVLILNASVLNALSAGRETPILREGLLKTLFLLGDAQCALTLSALVSVLIMIFSCRMSLRGVEKEIARALTMAGMIILITSAGGAFGSMLRTSGVGERIESLATVDGSTGIGVLFMAFAAAAMIKTAQGSSTTALITVSAIFSSLALSSEQLGFNLAYLAVAIGAGACVTSWMNDSGFCIFSQMSGIKETDALKTWSVGVGLLGCAAFLVCLVLSKIVPLQQL